jgi:DNA-binding response OmpR family regulator
MPTPILALEKDLFFAVKIRDTLRHHDYEVTIARDLPSFEQNLTAIRPALVIINIATRGVDWEQAIRLAHDSHYPILTFGSHKDLDLRARALQAGATRVVANSQFAQHMPTLVQRLLTSPTTTATSTDDEDF